MIEQPAADEAMASLPDPDAAPPAEAPEAPSGPSVPAPGVPTKFCFACGTILDARAEICPKCGVRQQPPPTQSIGAAGSHSRIVAALLAIFLGSIGIHRFYLGKTTAGIVTIVAVVITFGLAAIVTGIIGLIEGIWYLTMTDDEFLRRFPG